MRDLFEAEAIANDLLRRARVDSGEPVDPRALLHRLGYELDPRPPQDCEEAISGRTVYYNPKHWRAALFHALGHIGVKLAGQEIHDEHLATAVGARLTVPMTAFRRALRAGLGRHSIAAQFGVNETCAALRYGEATGEPVAIITPSTIYVAGLWPWPAEDLLRRMVRERHRALKQERMRDRKRVLVRLVNP